MIKACSLAMVRNSPHLRELLGESVTYAWPFANGAQGGVLAYAGWGAKKSGRRAEKLSRRDDIACWRLEDGFVRSIGSGPDEPPLSIVIDDLGIYYDATRESRLEKLIVAERSPDALTRARELMSLWRRERVSKYNRARDIPNNLPDSFVLVIDQTFGDASIRHGLADSASFRRMLNAALAENPDATVIVKVHPEVLAGRRRGHFDIDELSRQPRVRLYAVDAHVASLIERCSAVYTVTSQVGFEGLLWQKKVRTFGMPFYAGWGLTQDDLPAPSRRGSVSLENLVHAALIDYSRYVDPETGKRCSAERMIEWVGLQRRMRGRFPEALHAVGFSIYKRPIVERFFQGSSVRFVRDLSNTPPSATVVVWGCPPVFKHLNASNDRAIGRRFVRLEDGFLRSVGLGADLVRPLSWVLDSRGIYYDATAVSDLEYLLASTSFDADLVNRANALRKSIVEARLTKYNIGGARWQRPPSASRVILVPGQVETDASIALGAPTIKTNIELLKAVRSSSPDAYVVYKPHPDVVAGLRRRGSGEDEAPAWCDEMVTGVQMADLLDAVDEVHVLTSLAGFEALLRGKKVVTYGLPFYAGWQLTEDRCRIDRRARALTLDELVAGVLILYPTYISRHSGAFTTPERALAELQAWRESGSQLPWWREALRPALRMFNRRG